MKLSEWLAETEMSVPELARRMGLRYPTNIYRYLHGRVPPPDVLRRISEITGGRVMANDFIHGLP